MKTRFVGGVALLFGAIGFSLYGGGSQSLSWFWDPATMLIVGGGTFGVLLIGFPLRVLSRTLSLAIKMNPTNEDEVNLARQIVDTGSRATIYMGIVALLSGLVISLGNLDNPASLGPAMAICLLGMFYAVGISMCLFCMRIRLAPSQASSAAK